MKKYFPISLVIMLAIVLFTNGAFVSNTQFNTFDSIDDYEELSAENLASGMELVEPLACVGCHQGSNRDASSITSFTIHDPSHPDYKAALQRFLDTHNTLQAAEKDIDRAKLETLIRTF